MILPVVIHGLSVTFVHCAEMVEDIDTVYFAYGTPMSLPDRVKIWLTLVSPFRNFAPVDLSIRDITCRLDIVQWSQCRAYGKPQSLFRVVQSLTPYDFLCPQNGGLKCTATNFATRAATW